MNCGRFLAFVLFGLGTATTHCLATSLPLGFPESFLAFNALAVVLAFSGTVFRRYAFGPTTHLLPIPVASVRDKLPAAMLAAGKTFSAHRIFLRLRNATPYTRSRISDEKSMNTKGRICEPNEETASTKGESREEKSMKRARKRMGPKKMPEMAHPNLTTRVYF